MFALPLVLAWPLLGKAWTAEMERHGGWQGLAAPFSRIDLAVLFLAFAVAAVVADVPERSAASRRFLPALRTGFRHVVNAHQFRRLVIVSGAWFVTGSAVFALLPVVALRELGLGPSQYGWVLAVFGGGAVVGTVLLAPYRARGPSSGGRIHRNLGPLRLDVTRCRERVVSTPPET